MESAPLDRNECLTSLNTNNTAYHLLFQVSALLQHVSQQAATDKSLDIWTHKNKLVKLFQETSTAYVFVQ